MINYHAEPTNDERILDEAIQLGCDLGLTITCDAYGNVWSQASLRLNRGVEYIGRVEDHERFRVEFKRRYYA